MPITRRQWLLNISALATLPSINPFLLAKPSDNSTQPLHWPPSLGSPVTESLRPVIENSRDVHTHYDKILEIARWMAYEELPMPNLAIPYGLEKTPDIAMDFVMVGNTIDTAFTDFKTHVKFQTDFAGAHLSDSEAMFAC
ncbi:MAG TPA: hypothetical protein VJQ54_14370, partial [Candidatus Sulfotelmatobacter sp.]|nr:hypothetical protein [Candidatus Sulfotelmatobacter sp.]